MNKTRDVAEFAAELGERFPDYSDGQVLSAVSEYAGFDLTEDTILGKIALLAYIDGDVERAIRTWS